MDASKMVQYLEALDIIESQANMMALKAAQFPTMKPEDQKDLHKHIHRHAYPANYEALVIDNLEGLKERYGQRDISKDSRR